MAQHLTSRWRRRKRRPIRRCSPDASTAKPCGVPLAEAPQDRPYRWRRPIDAPTRFAAARPPPSLRCRASAAEPPPLKSPLPNPSPLKAGAACGAGGGGRGGGAPAA